ncbi:hypothetical protein L195_g044675 [Trifolium pratense]|uniref:Uncharacterized protein n=1 Tax=Trifolium pratense TaxID=57577 RepID=A0A2K3MCS8_TRIPR|nr:hypothetical protein L195_g044675 [Trifolium pratense]
MAKSCWITSGLKKSFDLQVSGMQAFNGWKEWFECNVNAGFHVDLGITSAGCCCRDSNDEFLMGSNKLEAYEDGIIER